MGPGGPCIALPWSVWSAASGVLGVCGMLVVRFAGCCSYARRALVSCTQRRPGIAPRVDLCMSMDGRSMVNKLIPFEDDEEEHAYNERYETAKSTLESQIKIPPSRR